MPNKTIYVADADLMLYQRAQELAGGSLSAAITIALRRYIEFEEGRRDGFEEITVRIGTGAGRHKQRFSGVLLVEWGRTVGHRVDIYHVYRTRAGRFVVHLERSAEASHTSEYNDQHPDGPKWRTFLGLGLGIGVGDQRWSVVPAQSRLEVVDSLEELREKVPTELYDLVAGAADQPAIEDLDI